ncbi:Crp/Fnr family transcriptional regulator [Epilithonimonas lactis]|uniref:Cyclic nucleotide-binding protein n=1 Tax=Epilithonimonas lactis TaxID=421072 RepID=A0A085BJK5_9FLAO|nr:Crp/Fnr family transcriptional regulator [Epilithonimonas lactis]KFC22650.1 cyclic nucleotide-binding protein [Epilithonimonas lactis]SEQ83336.1 cAMP-binding domain of CRP or a regulatory subunit of cAMP-dependent protein kinases [Epilithonimonas lactis]
MTIDQILDDIYPIPDSSKSLVKKDISLIKYPKGQIIINADKIESNVYFIKQGIARAFSNDSQNEITFWFGKEGSTVLSMMSYISNGKGYEDIELLEDSELYQIKSSDLQDLFIKDIHLANWGRKFAEKELAKTEQLFISRQTKTATERYIELLEKTPHLIQRVQLRYIASYLGITQVSLSRIRAEIK